MGISSKPKFSETAAVPPLPAAFMTDAPSQKFNKASSGSQKRVSDIVEVGDSSAWNDKDDDLDLDL